MGKNAQTEEVDGRPVPGVRISITLFVVEPAYDKEYETRKTAEAIYRIKDSINNVLDSLNQRYNSFYQNLDFNDKIELGYEKFMD